MKELFHLILLKTTYIFHHFYSIMRNFRGMDKHFVNYKHLGAENK